MNIARAAVLVLASVCAGCAGGSQYSGHWDGRRGYDGNGDYGYDVAASRSEAGSYRSRAARSYAAPGPRDDPWGPYIHEAAARFQVPERWIRAVMRQESGGRLYETDGSLITSSAGAMGLMQVMPRTYDTLQRHYGLGSDPFDPRDNILAGTAYIREMYDRYGSPGFLAAYNAGPDRLEAYLSGGNPLPDETVNYLASVAPRLGTEVPASGPLATYAGADDARSGMSGQDDGASGAAEAATDDPSVRAFEGGGLVTASAPTGAFTPRDWPDRSVTSTPLQGRTGSYPSSRNTAAMARLPVLVPVAAAATRRGDWGIQVGAYADPANSEGAIARARAGARDILVGTQPAIMPVRRAGLLYRARLVGLSAESAAAACARLSEQGMDCITVPPGPAL